MCEIFLASRRGCITLTLNLTLTLNNTPTLILTLALTLALVPSLRKAGERASRHPTPLSTDGVPLLA